jgi:hypothetical protein
MNMNKLVNTLDLHTVNFIQGRPGTFRTVSKCPAGFYTIQTIRTDYAGFKPADILSMFKKGGLATIEFKADDFQNDIWLTVFAMKGKRCMVIDQEILVDLTVGTINSYWIDTNLYSQVQYAFVNAKNWASKAFSMNAA